MEKVAEINLNSEQLAILIRIVSEIKVVDVNLDQIKELRNALNELKRAFKELMNI